MQNGIKINLPPRHKDTKVHKGLNSMADSVILCAFASSWRKNTYIFSWLPYLVFFAGSFIYFGFFANYIFFYQEKSSLFIFSIDFLKENLHQPGGLLIWIGKLLSTFYYYSLCGSLILSTVLTLSVFFVSKIINQLTGEKALVVPFLIGITLFYLQTDYHFLLYNELGILLQLVLFYLIVRWNTFFRGLGVFLIAPFCYFTTGGFAIILLILSTFYFLLYDKKNWWIKLLVLWCLCLITIYISKEFLFFQPGKTLLTFPFTGNISDLQQIILIAIAVIISFLPVLCKVKSRFTGNLRNTKLFYNLTSSFVLAILLIIIGIQRYDNKTKQYFRVENLFYQEKYEEVIAYNISNPPTNMLTIFLNNIALCETDRLDDMMFHFQQDPDGRTLFLKWEMVSEVLNRGGYFYYTIGMINEAHRWFFENMVMKGHTPEGLKMLIKTELINGNYEVASRYINTLNKTLFYCNEAKKFERLLFKPDAINSDKQLGKKKKIKVGNDFFSITDNPYINIEMILSSDSLNKKAFEYKMAFMLLKKNYKGIAQELPGFGKLGYTRLPAHVEEAAIALAVSNKGRLPETGNLQISKNTELRWKQYLSVLQQYKNDVKSAEPALKRGFGDTFWYYVFYK
jgi:hypothetical protein